MTKLHSDEDRYGTIEADPLVEAVHCQMRALVRRKFGDFDGPWRDFVFVASDELISRADIEEIEGRIIAAGHRFQWSAMISAIERPEAYAPLDGVGDSLSTFSFEHPEAPVEQADSDGRALRGVGDNVARKSANCVGTARYVRTNQQVLDFMKNGVPKDTVAIIDDSGGTLTAPILEQFSGVVCAGGTVRSHLGILTREYGIPCLMNARISGIREGDEIEIESSAEARTARSYQEGREMPARVWKLES